MLNLWLTSWVKEGEELPRKITLEIDSDEAFDYEKGVSPLFKIKDYQRMIEKEAQEVHAQRT